ncbi:MAG: sigma-70 family RNA polymerase sigma factor [Balneolaceae bacterium]|nr:sigma-70 family RNA polymerase sigma factor [Balneolaceae bacterium]
MDYSKFVTAIIEKDEKEVARQVEVIIPVLIKFLKVRYGASHHDAEDCAQNTLLIAIEKIHADELNSPDAIIYYLFTTAKYDYFKSKSKNKEINFEEVPESHFKKSEQLTRLIDEEKMTLLEECIEQLKADYKTFIEYWFENPASDASTVAEYFNISINNVWTRKHRVIQVLKSCFKEKSQLHV